ncbi:C-type lectin 16, partial [Diplonema papillatum]
MGQNLWYRIAAASLPLLLFPTRVDACVDDSTCGGGQCELGTCTTPVIRNIDHRSIDYFLVAAPTATWDEAGDRCGYVVANGRLARVLYQSEQERLLALSTNVHVLFDGTDKAEEGVWRWSDGTVFYTRAGGCQQAYCGWDGKYPDNSNGIEHHLSMYQTWWNDVSPAAGLRTFFCEVPCTADADCEDDRVLNE